MSFRESRPIEVLLIEDNEGDVRLMREIFKEGRILNNLRVVKDGVEAMEYLRGNGDDAMKSTPDIIFLDLNLPRKDGFEVLEEIKGDPRLRVIPVIVLTSSKAREDIVKSYEKYANCYITKPADLEQFIKMVQAIEEFWFTMVKFPLENAQ